MNELFLRAQRVIPGGVHSPVRSFKSLGGDPIFFESAEGPYLKAVNGKKYIDYCQSFGPNILGHRDPDVSLKVKEQIDRAWTLGACDPHSLELSEWITSRVKAVDKIRFVCSGTEAVMSALRLARAFTGRDKILKFEGCYHGHVDSMLVKAGSGLAGESARDSAGVTLSVSQDTLVCPLDDLESLKQALSREGENVAALIMEPLPANYGLLPQDEDFIRQAVHLARSRGALVIFDEVISGFRVGLGGMAERLGLVPDLVTYGKVMGGGFPVGAFGGRKEIMDLLAPLGPVYQAGTLAANPVGVAAGLATLQKLESQNLWHELNLRSGEFFGEVERLFEGSSLQITHDSSLFWIHARGSRSPPRRLTDFSPRHGELFKKFFDLCLEGGVYLSPSAFEVNFLSLAHTPEVLARTLDVFKGAVRGSE